MLKRDTSWFGRFRDGLVHSTVNFLIRKVATRWYRQEIEEVLRLGLREYRR